MSYKVDFMDSTGSPPSPVYGAEHLNGIRASLMTKGVVIDSSASCKVIAAATGKVRISAGTAIMHDGSRIVVDPEGVDLDILAGGLNYVFFRRSTGLNTIQPIISLTAPEINDVPLATVSAEDTITDTRLVSRAKPAYAPPVNMIKFTQSGVWLCPPGVTEVDVWVVGAGGKGGSGAVTRKHGGGGGGGYCNFFRVLVTPGTPYEITVGTDSNEGYSQFASSTYRSNKGSNGGDATSSAHGAAGIGINNGGSQLSSIHGGSGSTGSINPYDGIPYAGGGGSGGDITSGNGGVCGGGGGGCEYNGTLGFGGIGYNNMNNGDNGYRFGSSGYGGNGGNGGANTGGGGGGGGGWPSGGSGGGSGGKGGSGVVIIYYNESSTID